MSPVSFTLVSRGCAETSGAGSCLWLSCSVPATFWSTSHSHGKLNFVALSSTKTLIIYSAARSVRSSPISRCHMFFAASDVSTRPTIGRCHYGDSLLTLLSVLKDFRDASHRQQQLICRPATYRPTRNSHKYLCFYKVYKKNDVSISDEYPIFHVLTIFVYR
ncbi:unnamed protein product [Macrosiphum euphorbiae]|uniref:Uncharacterized protein n=1 Tax=Macrosiphum euphorbiae TaxID=13131 RepID=A0AAV0WQH6_9HEMI|nr:unnamed protein product [Macrosiphum euphorbiae]